MTQGTATDLRAALSAGPGDLISLVGGGGKTTAMYRLTSLLRQQGLRCAAATTTKIAAPVDTDGVELFCAEEWSTLRARLAGWDWRRAPPVLGHKLLTDTKVQGISPDWCDQILAEGLVDAVVVEADGAARRAVKAPEAWEPVVPTGTTHFVAVLGLSCVEEPLTEKTAFRARRIQEITGLAEGAPFTTEALARLLTSREGLLKGCPQGARATALLNQADLPGALEAGRRIAESVLTQASLWNRILLATLRNRDEPVEVWNR